MIDPSDPSPAEGRMTEITTVGGSDMARQHLLAGSRAAVVTREAVSIYATVVEARQTPIGGGVAVVTHRVAAYVIARFACSSDVIMAAITAYRCAHEDAADVACVAFDMPMAAG